MCIRDSLCHLLADMGGAKSFHVDLEDEVVRGALVLEKGEVRWPPPRREPKPAEAPAPKRTPSLHPAPPAPKPAAHGAHAPEAGSGGSVGLLVMAVVIALAGQLAPPGFLSHLTVFVLACFVGWRVVWNVTPALHTPLMSVTNAISGIILIGGMLSLGGPIGAPATILGALAIFFSAINVAGGFLVTQRMLRMFRK